MPNEQKDPAQDGLLVNARLDVNNFKRVDLSSIYSIYIYYIHVYICGTDERFQPTHGKRYQHMKNDTCFSEFACAPQ